MVEHEIRSESISSNVFKGFIKKSLLEGLRHFETYYASVQIYLDKNCINHLMNFTSSSHRSNAKLPHIRLIWTQDILSTQFILKLLFLLAF
jgi:hypothetical protein